MSLFLRQINISQEQYIFLIGYVTQISIKISRKIQKCIKTWSIPFKIRTMIRTFGITASDINLEIF